MLESMRKQSRSVLIYVFFCLIIAVFITSFGPASEGFANWSGSTSYVARIEGRTLGPSDFRYAWVLARGPEIGSNPQLVEQVRNLVMDKLIEREMLASRAESLGLRVSDVEIDDQIAAGTILAFGVKQDAKAAFFNEGVFDYEMFDRFCRFRLGQSVKEVKQQQRRELLALRVRELMRAAVRVSDEEARADFENRGRQVNLEFVRFLPGAYAGDIRVTSAEADQFLGQNGEKVKERFHTRSADYKGVPKQARVRHVMIAVAQDAPRPAQEAARLRAEGVLAEVKQAADFAAVARERSDHESSKGDGGDLGWRSRGGSGFGAAFEDAAFLLQPGTVSALVRSDAGWHVLKVDGFRQGDLKIEQVQQEIARGLLRERRAGERAQLEAEDHLRRLRAGEDWEKMFPPEQTDDEGIKPAPIGALIRRDTGMFTRSAVALPSIGIAPELATDAFSLTVADPLGKKVYPTAGGPLVLVRLKERQDPDMKDFEQKKSEIIEDYRLVKAMHLGAGYVLQRCQDAQKTRDLVVSEAAVASYGGQGAYVPCATLKLQ